MKPRGYKPFWVAISVIGILFSAIALYQTFTHISELIVSFWISDWFPLVLLELSSLLGWLTVCILAICNAPLLEKFEFPPIHSIALRFAGGLFAVGMIAAFVGTRYWMIGKGFEALFVSLTVLWISNVFVAIGIKTVFNGRFASSFLGSLLIFGVVFIVAAKVPQVTSYPLSLGWSEASRYYYGSLVFSEKIYGLKLPLSIWHPSRYLLQSLPFLYSKLPIWIHRLWQVILWLGMAGLSAYFLVRRLHKKPLAYRILIGLWFFVFLFQGAVYYNLLICVILVLAGYSGKRPWKSFLFLSLASFWAGISRFNWYPVPAMIAASIYFIEEPSAKRKISLRYLIKPFLWVAAGTLIAFLSQAMYVLWSGNGKNLSSFGSSFFSDLLWYRLFPNPSYALGVLPGILLISLPIFIIIFIDRHRISRNVASLSRFGILAILSILFIGGLVVSVKVGGGGDLHNMDAYMVLLAITAVLLSHHSLDITSESHTGRPFFWPSFILAAVVPITLLLGAVVPLPLDEDGGRNVLKIINAITSEVSDHGGRILFITQRHLLTFGNITDVPLIPEYEILTLNEMAISGNEKYLSQFYQDLNDHKFDLIVADYQYGRPKQQRYSFGRENDLWTLNAGRYLTCEYIPFLTFQEYNIQLLIPRIMNPTCP